jgi:hypothetical protein
LTFQKKKVHKKGTLQREKEKEKRTEEKKKFNVQVLTVLHIIIFMLFRAGWTIKLVSYRVNLRVHVSHGQLKRWGRAGRSLI